MHPKTTSRKSPLALAAMALRKLLVTCVGGGLLVAGLAMLVLPGPALLVIPAGLAVLAAEYHWARRCLGWVKQRIKSFSSRSGAGDQGSSEGTANALAWARKNGSRGSSFWPRFLRSWSRRPGNHPSRS